MSRCRICSANDEKALIEDIARAMWETQISSNPDDEWREWERTHSYWRDRMMQFAAASLKALRASPVLRGEAPHDD